METNPYQYNSYDRSIAWIPQQNQVFENRAAGTYNRQRPLATPPQQRSQQGAEKQKAAQRMPKARALALADRLKKGIVVTSIVAFCSFSGLIAYHQVSATTAQTSKGSTAKSSSSSSTSTQSSNQNSNSSSFFNQGGSNFGASNSSSAPVTGSHVSQVHNP